MAQVSTQQPHRHYIYKYVAGGSGGALSGNNIRPFKYTGGGWVGGQVDIFHWWGTNKKKENSTHYNGTTLFFKKEIILWTNTFIYVNKN